MLLSVIIPFFNAEKYLSEAIESVICCEQIDIELVLVNDGSTDNSLSIVQKYVQEYKNIKLYQQENGGVSSARNLGLAKSNGDYIMFLDADDILDGQIYFDVLPYLQSGEYDILFFGVEMIKFRQYRSSKRSIPPITLTTEETLDYFFSKKISGFNAGKVYKKKLFQDNDITFPLGKIFEDLEVLSKILPFSRRNLWFETAYYYYDISNESALTKCFTISNIASYHELNCKIFDVYSQSIWKIDAEKINYYLMDALIFELSELYKMNYHDTKTVQFIKEIKNEIKVVEQRNNFSQKGYTRYSSSVLKYWLYKMNCLPLLIKLRNRKLR